MGDYEHSKHGDSNIGSSSQKIQTPFICKHVTSFFFPLGHFYRLEGAKDFLLCGNSSDAG